MSWIKWFFAALLALSLGARGTLAVTAEIAGGDAARAQRWETLNVRLTVPTGGCVLSVRDVRGGVTVSRQVNAGGDETETGVLMPLPFVAESELPAQDWPVEVTVAGAAGEGDREIVEVRRADPEGGRAFRVAAAEGETTAGVKWGGVTDRTVVRVRVPAAELLAGPALSFAGFDAIAFSREESAQLDERRLLALANVGVRVVVMGSAAPTIAGRENWAQLSGQPAWAFPRHALPTPPVIEPGLRTSRVLQVDAAPSGEVYGLVALTPLAAVVLVLLARGLFRRTAVVLIASAVGLAGVTVGAVALLNRVGPATERVVGWSTFMRPTESAADGSRVVVAGEEVVCDSALFGKSLHVVGDGGTLLLPVAPDARTYFGWKNVRLTLEAADNGTPGGMTLDMALPARRESITLKRTASLVYPETSAGWDVKGGYVETGGTMQLLTAWAAGQPAIRESLLGWYDLRFDAAHSYVLRPSAATPGEIVVEEAGAGKNGGAIP